MDEYAFAYGKHRRFTAIILFHNTPTNQNFKQYYKSGATRPPPDSLNLKLKLTKNPFDILHKKFTDIFDKM